MQGNAHLQEPQREEAVAPRHLLVDKNRHGSALAIENFQRRSPATLAAEVDDRGRRHVIELPAGSVEAIAPVDVLAVHEVVLVEQADLVHGGLSHHHAGTRQHLDLGRLLGVEMGQMVAGNERVLGKEAAQARHLAEGRQWRGKAAAAVELQGAVWIEDFAAAGPGFRVLVQERDHRVQRVSAHDGIGVDQQRVFAGHLPQGHVVAGREPHIGLVANQLHVRKFRGYHVGAAIGRGVVNDEYLRL